MTETNRPEIKPVSTKERIKELDIVRGFALFGVLLVNMVGFNTTLFSQVADVGPLSNPLQLNLLSERLSALFIQIFAVGKFYTIFSFLFGLGFYIFMERAESKNTSPKALFARRSFFLFLFGILHLTLVWYGDILHVYGITGFILILFRNSSLKTIRNWLIALLTISLLMISGFTFLNDLVISLDEAGESTYNNEVNLRMEESVGIYRDGTYTEVITYRIKKEIPLIVGNLIAIIPKILGMFLIGLYVGKRKILNNIEGSLSFIKKSWKVSGTIGILSTVVYVLVLTGVMNINTLFYSGFIALFKEISTVFLSMFYVTSLVLLYQRKVFKKILKPLSYMGQMALTNYLVQCILCSLIFYGYGLGRLGNTSVLQVILFTVLIYIGQILYSKAWLQKFKYGPFEAAWRYLTYRGSI